MKFKPSARPSFLKKASALEKKYTSFKVDLKEATDSLTENPMQGESLGAGIRKIRLNIRTKNAGKQGGGRIVICVLVQEEELVFISVYDKSEKESEDISEYKAERKAYLSEKKKK